MEAKPMEAQVLPKADLGKRFVATLIDGVLVFIVGLIPILGAIIGLAYILTRDSIVYMLTKNEDFKNRSLGKKLMGLRVVNLSGQEEVDIMTSIKRNFILVIGGILGLILAPIVALATRGLVATGDPYAVGAAGIAGILGLVAALLIAIIGMVPVAVESLLVITSKSGLRLGDKFANTHVVED